MSEHRAMALVLRLMACELTHETRSIFVLRHTLHDLGWTDAMIDAAQARVRAALYVQTRF